MNESPDSAYHLLQTVPSPSEELQYATWALLTAQARYKLYMQQSDSLINIAYNYFMEHGDAQRKTTVLYYKGAICKEHQQIEEAHTYYLQAAEEVKKTNNYQLGYFIYQDLTDTYAYQQLKEYALKAAEQAYMYAKQSNNPRYMATALFMLARVHSLSGNFTAATSLYKGSIAIDTEINRFNKANETTTELIGIYFLLENLDSVKYYTRQFLNRQQKYGLDINSAQYSVIGEAYRLMGKPDSAYFYLKEGIDAFGTSIYIQRGLYRRLLDLSVENNDYKSATMYANKLIDFQDSTFVADKTKELAEIQEKYDQQKLINEKNELKIKKDAVIRNTLIGLSAALLLIVVLTCKLLRKERRIQEAEEEIRSKSIRIQENEQTISRNRKRMQELEEQMEAEKGMQEELEEQRKALAEIGLHNEQLEEENRSLQRDIDGMSATLKEKSVELEQLDALSKENLRLRDREWFLSSLLLENDETLCRLKKSPHYVQEEEWNAIKRSIDTLFDHFIRRLTTAIPSLTENELQLCCLIKLHFPNPAIATMLAIEPASVSKRKFRLKERIIQKTGNWSGGTTLELWLWNF